MEKQTQNLKDWYTEYKEKKLEKDIQRCNAFAIVSGAVATLSSLVVAGNIVVGNNLEAMQVGGSTAAMVAYLISYSKMSSIYKKEKDSLSKQTHNPNDFIKERLETLKLQLEQIDTSLSMDYLVSGGFYLSSLGHIIELISTREPINMLSSISGAALSGLVATLYVLLSKNHKKAKTIKETELEKLEEMKKLDEMSKEPIPELIEREDTLEIESPSEEEPKKLQLEEKKTLK